MFTSDLYTEIPFVRLEDTSETVDGIPVRRFRAHSLGGEMHYVFTPSLLRALLAADADIVHAHSYGYFHVGAACLKRKLQRPRFVMTPHFHPSWSMWGGERRRMLRRVYDGTIGKHIIGSLDALIGVSGTEISQMDSSPGRGIVRTIPNGIDFHEFDPIPSSRLFREKYGIEDELILFVGRLASNKGLITLVEAIPEVIKDFPKARFVLVGEDSGMRGLISRRAKDLGVRDSLLMTGHISDADVFRSAYASCDVFVLPSEYEAFGIVLLEAMACEKPCVASRVGGTSEVVEDGVTGTLVKYGSASQLAGAIKRLLVDPEKGRQMGRMGRERVRREFTWEKVVDAIEDLYGELTRS